MKFSKIFDGSKTQTRGARGDSVMSTQKALLGRKTLKAALPALLFLSFQLFAFPTLTEAKTAEYKCNNGNLGYSDDKLIPGYYVNPNTGKDEDKGTTPLTAFKTLDRLNQELENNPLGPGGKVFLASGTTLSGQLRLVGAQGTEAEPVEVTGYGNCHKKPHIDGRGYSSAVYIASSKYLNVNGLELSANGSKEDINFPDNLDFRAGVFIEPTTELTVPDEQSDGHITLSDLDIHDIYFEDPGWVRGVDAPSVPTCGNAFTICRAGVGWGVGVSIGFPGPGRTSFKVIDITLKNSTIHDVSLFAVHSKRADFKDITIENNNIFGTGSSGIVLSRLIGGYVGNNVVDQNGGSNDTRKGLGSSRIWTFNSEHIVIEHNKVLNAVSHPPQTPDAAGIHIDWASNNITVQYNLSYNNSSGFVEILGGWSFNNIIRYNVSVNDGWLPETGGAYWPGAVLFIDSYGGQPVYKHLNGPYNTYIYNNTAFIEKDLRADYDIADTSVHFDNFIEGLWVANNIIYVNSIDDFSWGDESPLPQEAYIQRNLLLKDNIWPIEALVQLDVSSDRVENLVGDPEFVNPGGTNVEDYIPTNLALTHCAGLLVSEVPVFEDQPTATSRLGMPRGDFLIYYDTLPRDEDGEILPILPVPTIGLEVEHDILGNPINGKPPIGAIVPTSAPCPE